MSMLLICIFVVIMGFILGAIIGSGFLCFLSRKKTGESWAKGRSHCDACGHVLGVLDLIPIVSYLAQKGKCRYCGAAIPNIVLKSELLFGAVFAFAALGAFFSVLLGSVSVDVCLTAVVVIMLHIAGVLLKNKL